MRVFNQGYLAEAWADVDRSNRIREARRKARGSVCVHCLRAVVFNHDIEMLVHVDAEDNADDAKDRYGVYCEGRMEAQAA